MTYQSNTLESPGNCYAYLTFRYVFNIVSYYHFYYTENSRKDLHTQVLQLIYHALSVRFIAVKNYG